VVFEPEETIGHIWHRLVGHAASYKRHPGAAVTLEAVQGHLPVLFRALGGDKGVRVAPADEATGNHRLSLRQRIGVGRERLSRAALDSEALRLPPVLDLYPEEADNRHLYEWLAAWFAHAGTMPPRPADPLQADVATLRHAAAATARTIQTWPGLRATYHRLGSELVRLRPDRARGAAEQAVERAVRALLADPGDAPGTMQEHAGALDGFTAPPRYQPFLPVPLWGEVFGAASAPARPDDKDHPVSPVTETETDTRRRRAIRQQRSQSQRRDPLVLHRFESIHTTSDMVNLDRDVDEDDTAAAKQAAADTDELTLGQNDQRVASALKLDLDLPAAAVDTAPLTAGITYPEWDYRRRAYHADHCRVVAEPAGDDGEDWAPDDATLRRVRQVRRHFEALRPRRVTLPAQADGEDLDLTALVRARADTRAGNAASDRLYLATRRNARDLAVAVLVDVSLSTEGNIQGRRVLDVEKEALVALSQGLRACGDDHAVFTFTSRRRFWVNVRTVKDFEDPVSGAMMRRVQALRPGHYTRMGAAIRHVSARLQERPNRHRLLLVLTDGKPNDIDHYEGRYGVEDTRMAIREARRLGQTVFGITVDEHAQAYFPHIFGRGAYAIFPHAARLTTALPAIYRQIAA